MSTVILSSVFTGVNQVPAASTPDDQDDGVKVLTEYRSDLAAGSGRARSLESLSSVHPKDLGAPYIDIDGAVILPVSTERGERLAAEWSREAGVPIATKVIPASETEGAILDHGAAVARDLLASGQVGEDIFVTIDGSQVKPVLLVVPSHLSDAEELLSDTVAGVDLAPNPGGDVAATTLDRQGDTSPFYGGGVVKVRQESQTSICTAGFPWRGPSGNPWLLTAGHCSQFNANYNPRVVFNGQDVQIGQSSNDYTTWNRGVGTVQTPGRGTWDGDLALLNLKNGLAVSPRIYVGGSNSSSSMLIGSVGSAAFGQKLCFSGITTGESCAFTVAAVGEQVSMDEGLLRPGVLSYSAAAYCPRPGDSGAPVYLKGSSSVTAIGIVSGGGGGGGDSYGGLNDPCKLVFTNIQQAYEAFSGSIPTG